MLDFENGIVDLVKRIDNVTIKLTDLFFKLEHELMELYSLSNNSSSSYLYDKRCDFNGKIKSEFGERMKKLLKEGLISGSEYSEDDSFLIAMDNSVMSLESLTSAVLGARFYTGCSFVVGDDSEENDARSSGENFKLEKECVNPYENSESDSEKREHSLESDDCQYNRKSTDVDMDCVKKECLALKKRLNSNNSFRKIKRQHKMTNSLISDHCDNSNMVNSLVSKMDMNSNLQDKIKKNNNKYGKTEITENSVLISLCRNILRLTKHRLEIEKYDSNVNKELEKIGRERYRELENKLIETEKKLKEREIKCYEYEKKIGYINFEEKIYDYDGLIGIKNCNKHGSTCMNDNNCETENEVIIETAFQSPRIEAEDQLMLSISEKNRLLPTKCNLRYEYDCNNKMNEKGDEKLMFYNNNMKVEENSVNECIFGKIKQDSEIIELKDQIQILTMDLLMLREENERLSAIITQTNISNDNNKTINYKQELTEYCNLSDEVIRESKSEVLFDILYGRNASNQDDTYSQKFNRFEIIFDENNVKKSELRVVKQNELVIKCVDESNENSILKNDKKGIKNSQNNENSTVPYLVMWEPIVDNVNYSSCNDDNAIPISISSYGQFKSSRAGKKSLFENIKYLSNNEICHYDRLTDTINEQAEIGEKNTITVANKTKLNNEKGCGHDKINRIKVNRNVFYCDIERIIRKNT
ncbi:hypothetical protein RS030_3479 [Cryptosporidium xiaoi]|uniref:Uncharacterized protein n=1 Tax=Cryptosporidium xiaoi TaxID=659607 RepID=A0AAV9XV97_9CRYT